MKALLLCGGQSSRMNSSKSLKIIHGLPAYLYWINLFKKIGIETYISCRQSQQSDFQYSKFIFDNTQNRGPMNGIHAAIQEDSNVPWFIYSVDLFYVELSDIILLINSFNEAEDAICYCNNDKIIYPLFSIISPKIFPTIDTEFGKQNCSLNYILKSSNTKIIEMKNDVKLISVNTEEQYQQFIQSN